MSGSDSFPGRRRRRRRVRWVVVPVVFVAVLGVRVQPAGAFLSALDPAGWAVVAQMAAVLSQSIAIKRQIENVRNQARAEFFGKLAPLRGKLSAVADRIRDTRSRAGAAVYNPRDYVTDLVIDRLPDFNRPFDECGVGSLVDCMPADAVLPSAAVDGYVAALTTATAPAPDASPTEVALSAQLHESFRYVHDYLRQRHTDRQSAVERAAERRAARRARVEHIISIVEDWRGCQPAPSAGGVVDPDVDDRLPCATNGGLGRGDGAGVRGTQGELQGLLAQLDAVDRFQDGDLSQNQIDTLQTRVLLHLGRVEAVRAEHEARVLEDRQREAMEAEAARRRNLHLQGLNWICQGEYGPRSYYRQPFPRPDPLPSLATDPAALPCLEIGDRSEEMIDHLRTVRLGA